ncbi:MAG: hypothetical protein KDC24_09590 [Saprospiraceae bacterium]|nr:hypothetical protein [Saprospiraceae bacterium]
MNYKAFLFLFLFTAGPVYSFGQQNDSLGLNLIQNPSFEEGDPQNGDLPLGWVNYGGTNTCIFHKSGDTKWYGVHMVTEDGDKFIRLVIKGNEYRECIGQDFEQPLTGKFTAKLLIARSDYYGSCGMDLTKRTNYNVPTAIQIKGINETGEKIVLFESEPVSTMQWFELNATFRVPFQMKTILITPTWKDTDGSDYTGNIVIDKFELYRSE